MTYRPLCSAPGLLAALALACLALPALAQDQPDYLDDRSTPAALVRSYYNAITRQEYARAWGYYADPKPEAGYDAFVRGFAETASSTVEVGAVTSEGAAGSVYSGVPVAVTATDADGAASGFSGCYTIVAVQPAIQEPPFRPLQISAAHLEPAADPAPPATCP